MQLEDQRKVNELILIYSEADESRAALRRHLRFRSNWVDKDFAFHISVRAALRERPVIMAELKQMVDKGVWHGIKVSGLSIAQRRAIIPVIAASEGRNVITIDIGGAFLNADIASTGIQVHMRLDRVMTQMLMQIDPTYQQYVEADGSMVVQLDKALYGCVEALFD